MPKTLTGQELQLDDGPARDSELFLVDGNNLAYRAFFALPEELATSDGFPTNALLGFTNMLFKLLSDYRPKGVAVAWDTRAVHRAAISEDYKRDRRSMPDLLREQFPHFRPIVEAFGYRNLEFEGWEADDVIATLATRADEAGVKTTVVSTDRDAFQLVSEHICSDDDAARRRGRQRLHARAGRAPLRRPARPGAGLHRAQGRHVRQHPRRPRHRRQDRGTADRAVRLARGGDRARGRALAGAPEEHPRARGPGADVQGAGDDAARSRDRLRSIPARALAAGPRAAARDLPPLRVPQPAEPRRRAGRGRAGGGAGEGRGHAGRLARGRVADRQRPRRARDRRRPLRAGARGRCRRRRLGSRARLAAPRRGDRRPRLQVAAAADDGARRGHADRGVPDRAGTLRVRDRRSLGRVRARGDSRAGDRGGDGCADPERRGPAPAGAAHAGARRASAARSTSTTRSSCR